MRPCRVRQSSIAKTILIDDEEAILGVGKEMPTVMGYKILVVQRGSQYLPVANSLPACPSVSFDEYSLWPRVSLTNP